MRALVAGAGGMLGTDVVTVLQQRGAEVRACGRHDLDVTDPVAVSEAVHDTDVVINCAAWTAVDDAETREADAFVLNAVAPQLLARAAKAAGAAVLHVSTDYVFDGRADQPYSEDAPLSPASAYGRTKAAGEWAVQKENPHHWVVRTAWLYGANGGCFPRTMARLAAERDELSVVEDQVGQPTWTVDVAAQLAALLEARAPWGIYHATASGQASWFEFASAVVSSAGASATVTPTTRDAFPRPAPRPSWSVLGHGRWRDAGIAPIPHWRERWDVAAETVLATDQARPAAAQPSPSHRSGA